MNVRSIVEDHAGTVTASNREDRAGARFTIRIPMRRTEDSAAAGPLSNGRGSEPNRVEEHDPPAPSEPATAGTVSHSKT